MRWPGKWSDADIGMAHAVNAYWVNFAKNGDPNGPGLPSWPSYTAKTDILMNFDRAGPKPVTDFDRPRLDAIDAVKASPL